MVNTTLNKFGKKLPPVKTGQRFGEEIKKDKKVGLFSERRFLIFTKRGPIEIAFKPIHYASVVMTTIILRQMTPGAMLVFVKEPT